jgi:hypothetical protein
MNRLIQEPEAVRSAGHPRGHRAARLRRVIADLEKNLAVLESLGLTLGAALLDHALAEVRQQVDRD